GRWTQSIADEKTAAAVVTVLGRPMHLAFGLNWGERLTATCAADWGEEPAGADVARGAETIRGLLGAALALQKPTDPAERLMHGLVGEPLRAAQVRREGKAVVVAAAAAT